MKVIQNIETDIINQDGKKATVADLGLLCARYVPSTNGGIDLDQVRRRLRVVDALTDAGRKPVIKMEDADYELFKQCIKSMKWLYVHEGIVAFEDAVNNATTQKL